MSGSIRGGKRAGKTNKLKYGEDFYQKIGAMGGRVGHTGGVYGDPERASQIGKLGAASRTFESRSKAAKKAWETKRAKQTN